MELERTRAALPHVEWLDSVGSTNAHMRERLAAEALPHGAVIATGDQVAGRGRLGRGWETPRGTALAASVLIRDFGRAGGLPLGWLPLLAGSAVAASLRPFAVPGARVGVKWPNDVHVRDEADAEADRPGLKLCGILCEALPSGEVIVGFGVNLLIPDWQLPTERSTSLLASGGDVGDAESLYDPAGQQLVDSVLATAASELLRLVALATERPESARVRVLRDSLTIGAEVRVHLPSGEQVDGRAVGLAEDGSLIVDRPTTGQLIVSAADVEHLRSPHQPS